MRAFHDAEDKRKAAIKKKRPETNENNYMELYNGFVKFVRSNDAWKSIARHVVVADERDNTSWITNGLLDGTFNIFISFLCPFPSFSFSSFDKSHKFQKMSKPAACGENRKSQSSLMQTCSMSILLQMESLSENSKTISVQWYFSPSLHSLRFPPSLPYR
jgi:hypothetical protein